jgi:hypothetical protein
MADKVDKPKKKTTKSKRDEKGVMSALPSTRPDRIGGRRGPEATKTAPRVKTAAMEKNEPTAATPPSEPQAPAPASEPAPAPPKSEPVAAADPVAPPPESAETPAKPKAAAKPKVTAAAKPKAKAKPKAAAKPKATAARRKAAAPRTFEPTPAAEAAAGAADERAAGAVPRAETRRQRPQAVREGAPGMGTTTERPDPASSAPAGEQASPEHGRPSGVELVTTAVQAAGEITQIGLAIGGRLLKRAVDRLPKP